MTDLDGSTLGGRQYPEMEETQTINEKCRDFVDSHIAKETEDEARKKLSESLEEEFEVRFLKNSRTKAE